MKKLLVLLLLCLPSWGAYKYKRSITITSDTAKVGSSTLTDFPLLVRGTYSYLATTGNGGKLENASGYDLDFFSDEALTTAIPWERVIHNLTTGEVEVYSKKTLAAGTVIWFGYGDSGVTTDQSDGSTAWTDYTAVWHFKDGTTLSLVDAKGSYTLTNSSATATTGKVDGGISFNGSNQYAYKSTSGSGMVPSTALSVSGWIYLSSAGNWGGPFGYHSDSNGWTWKFNGATRKLNWICRGNWLEYGTALATSTWYHVVTVGSSAGTKIYINGAEVATSATNPTVSSMWDSGEIRVGRSMDGNYWPGSIDEMRVRKSLVSADWILAEYNNQNSPGTFYTIGDEVSTSTTRRRAVIAWSRQ